MLSRLRQRLLTINRGVAADLVLVFLAAFGVRSCWAAITPPWLSPDEPAHFTYVAHLVENREIPQPFVWDARYPALSQEYRRSCELTHCWKLSALGGGRRQMSSLPLSYDYDSAREYRLDSELRKTGSGSTASEYPPLYYAIASLPYRAFYHHPVLIRALGVRAASAWLSALACAFGYLFAYEFYKSRLWGRAVALSLAFMPMYAFIGGSINNDAAMFAGTSALWWLLARTWVATEFHLTTAFMIGAVAGVSMLGKTTAAPLVVLAGLLVAAKALRRADGWRWHPRAAIPMAMFALGFALTEGSWYLYRTTHTLVAPVVGPGRPGIWKIVLGEAQYSVGDYLRELYIRGWDYFNWLFVKSFWALFGWLEIYLPETAYTAIGVVMAASALGLVVRFWIRPAERAVVACLLAAILFNAAVLLFAADFVMAFAIRGSTYGMQGRYFFGTLVPFMLLLIVGLCGLLGERAWVLRTAPLLAVILQITSFLTMLETYYGVSLG
jgi:Predicted membrane protein (DUF2142)